MSHEEMRRLEQTAPSSSTEGFRRATSAFRTKGPLRLMWAVIWAEATRFLGRRRATPAPSRLGNPGEHWVLILGVVVLLAALMTIAIVWEVNVRSEAIQQDLFAKLSGTGPSARR